MDSFMNSIKTVVLWQDTNNEHPSPRTKSRPKSKSQRWSKASGRITFDLRCQSEFNVYQIDFPFNKISFTMIYNFYLNIDISDFSEQIISTKMISLKFYLRFKYFFLINFFPDIFLDLLQFIWIYSHFCTYLIDYLVH